MLEFPNPTNLIHPHLLGFFLGSICVDIFQGTSFQVEFFGGAKIKEELIYLLFEPKSMLKSPVSF